MSEDRRQNLIELGAAILADALMDLAVHSDIADDLIESLVSTAEENARRFRRKLAGLRRRKRFVGWRESSLLARELTMMLHGLRSSISDPLAGVELIAEFFRTDEAIFENCDDSSGYVGSVFRYEAADLFFEYASTCTDQEGIGQLILDLAQEDEYGVRSSLIDRAAECLSEDLIRSMISEIEQRYNDSDSASRQRRYLIMIESLAQQIGDAKLFERARLASREKPSPASFIDIARVYLQSGDIDAAQSWIDRVAEDEVPALRSYERNALILEIARARGDQGQVAALLHEQFRRYRSTETFEDLLTIIGDDKRDELVKNEIGLIKENLNLCLSDVVFLMSIGKIDEAEEYLIERANQLDGDLYVHLRPLAKKMESEDRNLAATLLYRSLLVSILDRAYNRAYGHGVRYLDTLDELALGISDWRDFDDHEEFKTWVREKHGRKKSFWSRYEVEK